MTSFNDLTERVKWLIEQKAITDRQFALHVGIAPSNFSRKLLGTQPWTKNDIRKISESGVSQEWLTDGTGEPFTTETTEQQPITATKPRMNVYANAGQLTSPIDAFKEQMPVIAQLPKYDYTIIIRGDSMEPEFRSGEEVACLDVTHSCFRQWGKPHVLNTSQGVILKRVYQGERGYKCVSDNKIYPDFEIPEEEVYSIGMVVGMLRTY